MNAPKSVADQSVAQETESKSEARASRLQVEVPTGMKAGEPVCTCDKDGCCAPHFPQPKVM